MSYHVFFSFSVGLSQTLMAPKGSLASIMAHVAEVEEKLGLEMEEQYRDNPVHWSRRGWPAADLDDKVLCETVEGHNRWVEWTYRDFAKWTESPVTDGEEITPEQAQQFWHGLERLVVPPSRWTGDYYRARMETLYEVMRGRPADGITFDGDALSEKQAGAVINLFSEYLDPQDLRLEVPRGCDRLASSYDGEYDWCERCAAVLPEDAANCKERGCPVQHDWCDEDRPIWFRDVDEGDEAYAARCQKRAVEQGWRQATAEEVTAGEFTFQSDRYGSASNAKDWVDLWLTEGER